MLEKNLDAQFFDVPEPSESPMDIESQIPQKNFDENAQNAAAAHAAGDTEQTTASDEADAILDFFETESDREETNRRKKEKDVGEEKQDVGEEKIGDKKLMKNVRFSTSTSPSSSLPEKTTPT